MKGRDCDMGESVGVWECWVVLEGEEEGKCWGERIAFIAPKTSRFINRRRQQTSLSQRKDDNGIGGFVRSCSK